MRKPSKRSGVSLMKRMGRRGLGPIFLGIALTLVPAPGAGQGPVTDQVSVVVFRERVLGVTPGGGLIPVRLAAGETVLAKEAKGINAFVHTTDRLLGFSGPLKRWRVLGMDVTERVITFSVTPRLILVQTDKRLYGFQGPVGRWKVQDLGVQEITGQVIVEDHVAVVVTDRRVLAFSAFTGGFFPEDLQADEIVSQVEKNDNIVILTTPARRLIFRSQLAVWRELQ